MAGGRLGQEVGDLARRVGIGDVHDAEPVGEPGHWDLRARHPLAGLVAAGELGLRVAVHPRNLEGGDGYRMALVGDVHQPEERRRAGRGLGHVFVGGQHDPAAVERERQRQRGVGGRDVGRAPVEPGDEARLAHVLDVEDHEAAVPVAHVEPVARADRMVAAVMPPRPARGLPAPGPLPRHPPAPDLPGPRRIVQIQDHHDIADVAVHLGGDVGVAPVEGEAVHPRAATFPERDLARPARVGDVVDHEAAAHPGRRLVRGLGLAVHHHEPVGRAHLVRVGLGRHLEGGQGAGPGGVAHVHDAGAVGRLHVGDVGDGPVHRDLAAARAVEPGDLSETLHARRDRGGHDGRSLADRGPIAKPGAI